MQLWGAVGLLRRVSAVGPSRDSLESSGHFSEASGAPSGLHFGLLSEDPWLGWAGLVAPGGSWWLLAAPGGSWRLLVAFGDP